MKKLFTLTLTVLVSFYAGQAFASSTGTDKPCPANPDRFDGTKHTPSATTKKINTDGTKQNK